MWLDSQIRLVSIVDFPDWGLPIKTMLSRFMLIIIIEKFCMEVIQLNFCLIKNIWRVHSIRFRVILKHI
jgi:hypothetical protein